MAASFDISIVRDLLDIVDDSNDQNKISENQYIQMCNALKSIHNKSNGNQLISNYFNNRLQMLNFKFNELSIELKNMKKPIINNSVKHLTHMIIAEQQNLFDKKVKVILDTFTNRNHKYITRPDGSGFFETIQGDIIVKTVVHNYLGPRHVFGPLSKDKVFFNKKLSKCGRFEHVDTRTVKYCQDYILNNSDFNMKTLKLKYTEINNILFEKDKNEWKTKNYGPLNIENNQIEQILNSLN